MTRGVAFAVLGCIGLGVGVLALARRPSPESPTTPAAGPIATPTASLFCEFYDFMHKSVVTSYDFGFDAKPDARILLLAQVSPDGSRAVYSGEERPSWSFAVEDDTPTMIAPDGETRIVMYGLKPGLAGVAWSEAGVRSTLTRNLEGRCRQAHLDLAHLDLAHLGSAGEATAKGAVTAPAEGKAPP